MSVYTMQMYLSFPFVNYIWHGLNQYKQTNKQKPRQFDSREFWQRWMFSCQVIDNSINFFTVSVTLLWVFHFSEMYPNWFLALPHKIVMRIKWDGVLEPLRIMLSIVNVSHGTTQGETRPSCHYGPSISHYSSIFIERNQWQNWPCLHFLSLP